MSEETALELAVGLLRLPSRARALRDAPLPRDVDALLNIVAGEARARADAARLTGLTEMKVGDAASFYIEQILLHPDADCYRALGANAEATNDQLRRNMALLLRWLHPDHEANSERTIYVGRVTNAWNNIKTAERRLAYDATRRLAHDTRPPQRSSGPTVGVTPMQRNGHAPLRPARPEGGKPRRNGKSSRRSRRKRRGGFWRILAVLLGRARPRKPS
jgi:hypothetical protein